MKFLVTVHKCAHLWCFLSAAVLHSVSAGGAYCAKTARARAAALGLEYPGVHGAPDLSSPAHNLNQPRTFSSDEPNMATYSHNQPGGNPFDVTSEQIHPRSSGRILPGRAAYSSVPSGHRTNQMLGFPRGLSVSAPESSFEEVKLVPQSQSDPMTLTPRANRRMFPHVHTKHDRDVDKSAPNRRGKSFSGQPPHQGWRRFAHNPTRGALGGKSPAHYWSRLFKKDKASSPTPVHGYWKIKKAPGHLARYLHAAFHLKPFVQGNTVLENLRNKAAYQNPEVKEPGKA